MRANHNPMNILSGTIVTWAMIIGGAALMLASFYCLIVMMMAAI